MLARFVILWLSIVGCAGCLPNSGPSATADPANSPPQTSVPAAPTRSAAANAIGLAPLQSATEISAAGKAPAAAPVVGTPAGAPPGPAAPSTESPAEGTERVVAKAGVGKQGQSLKEHTGVLVEPAKALFNVRQKAVFEIQIPSAIKLFEATEGRKPQSHDEFMAKIIAPNQIKLPELPAGSKYVYDPQRGELMVEQPAK